MGRWIRKQLGLCRYGWHRAQVPYTVVEPCAKKKNWYYVCLKHADPVDAGHHYQTIRGPQGPQGKLGKS